VASFAGIAATGKSIERLLNAAFEEEEPVSTPGKKTHAVLVRTSDFEELNIATAIGSPALSVFLYRVDSNKTMRAAWSGVGSIDGRSHFAVDLHYLLTPWADNAEFEQRILGKTMQCLETTPVLSGPLLHPSGNWAANETVQVISEELPPESVLRAFDSLPTDYRLSVAYVARVVRIDGRLATPDLPATTVTAGSIPSTS
jgi:hypothetical protein